MVNNYDFQKKHCYHIPSIRYGETTAAAGGITEGASQMDTTDSINDLMIVITDGFDGDLSALQSASAAVAADGITAIGVAYEENGGILVCIFEINV